MSVASEGEDPTIPAAAAHVGGRKAFLGPALVTVYKATIQISALLLLVIAARVLTPAELAAFGLVSVTAMTLLQVAETGWFERASSATGGQAMEGEYFWAALGVGLAAGAVGLAVALGIAVFLKSTPHALVMAALSLMVAAQPMAQLQAGLLTGKGKIGYVGAAGTTAEVLGLAVGVAGLFAGWGIFALMTHRLTVTGLYVSMIVAAGRWRPAFSWRAGPVGEAMRFYWTLVSARAIGLFNTLGIDYLVALYLGLHLTGQYRAGSRVSGSVAELVHEPSRMIAWSVLPKAYNGPDGGAAGPKAAVDYIVVVFAIALPMFLGLILVADPLVMVLLGPQWSEAATILIALSLARFAFVVAPMVMQVMLVYHQHHAAIMRINASFMALSLTSMVAVGWMGLSWVLGAQIAAAWIFFLYSLHVLRTTCGVPVAKAAPDCARVALAAAVMALAVAAVEWLVAGWSAGPKLALSVFTGGVVYLAGLWVLRPRPVMDLVALWRRR